MADDVLVEFFVDGLGSWRGANGALGLTAQVFTLFDALLGVQDVVTDLDALVANVHAGGAG